MLDSEETPLFPNLASGDGKGRDSGLRRKARGSAIRVSNEYESSDDSSSQDAWKEELKATRAKIRAVQKRLRPESGQRKTEDSSSEGDECAEEVSEDNPESEYEEFPRHIYVREPRSRKVEITTRVDNAEKTYEYDFYTFVRTLKKENDPHVYGESVVPDLFERLRTSRLAEIHRQYENEIQQIILRNEGQPPDLQRRMIMDRYREQNELVNEFCREMNEFDKRLKQEEADMAAQIKEQIKLVQLQERERLVLAARSKAKQAKIDGKQGQERKRARDRATDASFTVKYTAAALSSGLDIEEIERNLKVRARIETQSGDKYDTHMMRQLEGRGKEVSASSAPHRRVHSWFVRPDTLDAFELDWEWEGPDSDHILVLAPLPSELLLQLHEHTASLVVEEAMGIKTTTTTKTGANASGGKKAWRSRGGQEKSNYRPARVDPAITSDEDDQGAAVGHNRVGVAEGKRSSRKKSKVQRMSRRRRSASPLSDVAVVNQRDPPNVYSTRNAAWREIFQHIQV
jgi:hypothetical protein